MTLNPSIILGAVLLVFLCYGDYRQKITRICNKTAYYSFMAAFLAINLAIYWILCNFLTYSLFSAAESNTLSVSSMAVKAAFPAYLQQEANNFLKSVSVLQNSAKTISYLAPPFIALAYFGLGANTLSIGSVKINFYSKVLHMVENLLPAKMSVWTDVKKAINEGDLERQHILQHLHFLRNEASRNQWDNLDEEWKEVGVRSEQLDQRCSMLEKQLAILNSGQLDQEILKRMREDTAWHLEDSQQRVLALYKRYLANFICINLRDEEHIRSVLNQIGIDHSSNDHQPINVHYRCLVMGIIAGMFIGPISALTQYKANYIPAMMFSGMMAVGLSNLIFSSIDKQFKKTDLRGSLLSISLIGGIAGYVGHFVFILTQRMVQGHLGVDIDKMIPYAQIPFYSFLGTFYGMATASIFWAYNYWAAPKIKNGIIKFVLLGTGGAFALWSTVFITRPVLEVVHGPVNMSGVFATGFIITALLGYGLDLYGGGLKDTFSDAKLQPAPAAKSNTPSS